MNLTTISLTTPALAAGAEWTSDPIDLLGLLDELRLSSISPATLLVSVIARKPLTYEAQIARSRDAKGNLAWAGFGPMSWEDQESTSYRTYPWRFVRMVVRNGDKDQGPVSLELTTRE